MDETIRWRDLITKDQQCLSLNQYEKILKGWSSEAASKVQEGANLEDACWQLYLFLSKGEYPRIDPKKKEYGASLPPCRHAKGSYITNHSLLTSAIAYCLGSELGLERPKLNLLRLLALIHDLPREAQDGILTKVKGLDVKAARVSLDALQRQIEVLNGIAEEGKMASALCSISPPSEDFDRILFYAHLAASQRLPVGSKVEFEDHPLNLAHRDFGLPRIALVFGGATKIKEYVFESEKLPEIRGASTLLDRINRYELRALFGERNGFRDKVGLMFDAPECVIYANGGDILALAPPSLAQDIAAEVERIYTEETLTANCIAVAQDFSLLELQYGVRPKGFWVDDYLEKAQDGELSEVLRAYYGQPEKVGKPDRELFLDKKVFGELASALSLLRYRRREGNNDGRGRKLVPHLETIPYGRRCSSCDRRDAVVYIPELDEYLCEPCARKRWVGWLAKRKVEPEARIDIFEKHLGWQPKGVWPWYQRFEGEYLEKHESLSAQYYGEAEVKDVDNPRDLSEIGKTSEPEKFIGVIYGDGNNVGAKLERIRTSAEYRQFSHRLFTAIEEAVFKALAENLKAVEIDRQKEGSEEEVWIHPFEIISIGGDDVFLIVPGHKALQIACDIARNLEGRFQSEWVLEHKVKDREKLKEAQRYQSPDEELETQPALSLSAGVVIASEHTPIYFLHDMVGELLRSAKRKAKTLKKDKDYQGGTIDLMALKSVSMVTSDIESFREEALWKPREEDILRLTARPYTLQEMEGLMKAVRTLKKARFPRSQLHHLRQLVLGRKRKATTLNYLYFRTRLDERYQRQLKRVFEDAWHRPDRDPIPWRWMEVEKSKEKEEELPCPKKEPKRTYETPIMDLMEIYEFVPEEEKKDVSIHGEAESNH